MVVDFPIGSTDRRGCFPGVVVEEVLRGMTDYFLIGPIVHADLWHLGQESCIESHTMHKRVFEVAQNPRQRDPVKVPGARDTMRSTYFCQPNPVAKCGSGSTKAGLEVQENWQL